MRKSIVIVLLIGLAGSTNAAQADETPRTGVIDRVGVMRSDQMQQLNAWLLELEQKTGAQLKVLIVPTTEGRDIYQYSIDMARRWQLGQKGKNNGALAVIAVKDRKWHVQTGEGIEGALPDLLVDQIAQQYFIPNFKKGDYSSGIYLGTIELARAIAKESGVALGGLPAQQAQRVRRTRNRERSPRDNRLNGGCFAMIVPLIVILIVFGSIMAKSRRMHQGSWASGRRRRRGFSAGNFLAGMILSNMLSGGRRGGGSSWGGGGFGGGGGGFGGGGGGSFGGGGAGGSW